MPPAPPCPECGTPGDVAAPPPPRSFFDPRRAVPACLVAALLLCLAAMSVAWPLQIRGAPSEPFEFDAFVEPPITRAQLRAFAEGGPDPAFAVPSPHSHTPAGEDATYDIGLERPSGVAYDGRAFRLLGAGPVYAYSVSRHYDNAPARTGPRAEPLASGPQATRWDAFPQRLTWFGRSGSPSDTFVSQTIAPLNLVGPLCSLYLLARIAQHAARRRRNHAGWTARRYALAAAVVAALLLVTPSLLSPPSARSSPIRSYFPPSTIPDPPLNPAGLASPNDPLSTLALGGPDARRLAAAILARVRPGPDDDVLIVYTKTEWAVPVVASGTELGWPIPLASWWTAEAAPPANPTDPIPRLPARPLAWDISLSGLFVRFQNAEAEPIHSLDLQLDAIAALVGVALVLHASTAGILRAICRRRARGRHARGLCPTCAYPRPN